MRFVPIEAIDMNNTVIWGFGSKSAAHAVNTLNEKKIIDIKDDHIKGMEAVGLWTKADSVTSF